MWMKNLQFGHIFPHNMLVKAWLNCLFVFYFFLLGCLLDVCVNIKIFFSELKKKTHNMTKTNTEIDEN